MYFQSTREQGSVSQIFPFALGSNTNGTKGIRLYVFPCLAYQPPPFTAVTHKHLRPYLRYKTSHRDQAQLLTDARSQSKEET
jgi:hypothetical protein